MLLHFPVLEMLNMNNNKYEDYYEARKIVQEIIRTDLLGPSDYNEKELISTKNPTNYYITGKLYPTNKFSQTVLQNEFSEELQDIRKQDDLLLDKSTETNEDKKEPTDEIADCNILKPSAFGITFALDAKIEDVAVELNFAMYKQAILEEILHINKAWSENPDKIWKRNPHTKLINLNLNISGTKKSHDIILDNGTKIAELVLIKHKTNIYENGIVRYTLSFKNKLELTKQENDSDKKHIYEAIKTLFQPKITLSLKKGTFIDVKRNLSISKDPDDCRMNLLYSKVKSYAQGHGCAVSWDKDEYTGNVKKIRTEFLPEEEVLQMRPLKADDLKTYISQGFNFNEDIFKMDFLANAPKKDITNGIKDFCNIYEKWILDREKEVEQLDLSEELKRTAKENIEECKISNSRIKKAADLINEDSLTEKAFRLANEAMFEQNKRQGKIFPWHPFQLAFILQEMESIINPISKYRNITDLLWFPTGGGKTEAYLGLAAFTIFIRRLKHPDNYEGVSVLTRYTYRLLTFQQFERTAILICACEQLRKKYNLGSKRISIGLWIGDNQVPNHVSDAWLILNNKNTTRNDTGNPQQVKTCPWCGAKLDKDNYSFDIDGTEATKMHIHCSDPNCVFSKDHDNEGLPVVIIDDQIYNEIPDFVVATVDKFAQIPQKKEAGTIFGYTKNKRLLPPDLIIQDELHLLTGPLGTIMGIYEAGFKKLCETKLEGYNYYPKIIASTATVKNAHDQIKALYCNNYKQFPAQCIDIENSFFAKISTQEDNDKPGRMYMGCMAVGTTPITMMVRVMAATLFATRYLASCKNPDGSHKFSNEVIDSFWTITGYFNTLRELGGAIIRVTDDIKAWVKTIEEKFAKKYPIENNIKCKEPKELTSRIPGDEISTILASISKNKYPGTRLKPVDDFLFATNMISVGVDVARLGTMVVVGQPKMTAEYIQSTSRVGRSNPGLVVTTYNQRKSRDRSHYEQFKQYHQSFYKYVESTTVTPFADRARSRALHTVYVMLCRYLIPQLKGDGDAKNYNQRKKFKNITDDIKHYLIKVVKEIDPDEENNLIKELDEIDDAWFEKTPTDRGDLVYRDRTDTKPSLFKQDVTEDERFRIMDNMRSVEKTVCANLYYTKEDRDNG